LLGDPRRWGARELAYDWRESGNSDYIHQLHTVMK
jgi:hypothetical protein